MSTILKRFFAVLFLLLGSLCVGALAGEQEVNRSEETSLEMWVTPIMPFDPGSPRVALKFIHRGGKEAIRVALPNASEVSAFRGIEVEVDGKKAEYELDVSLDNVAFSDVRELKPGENVELVIPLQRIFKMPKSWKTLVIRPCRIHKVDGLRGGVVITRPERG